MIDYPHFLIFHVHHGVITMQISKNCTAGDVVKYSLLTVSRDSEATLSHDKLGLEIMRVNSE